MSRQGKLKVLGVNTHLLGVQARTIAAVTSQKQFAELTGTTLGYIRDYAAETDNEEELKTAYTHCGCLFVRCPTCLYWHEWPSKQKS